MVRIVIWEDTRVPDIAIIPSLACPVAILSQIPGTERKKRKTTCGQSLINRLIAHQTLGTFCPGSISSHNIRPEVRNLPDHGPVTHLQRRLEESLVRLAVGTLLSTALFRRC